MTGQPKKKRSSADVDACVKAFEGTLPAQILLQALDEILESNAKSVGQGIKMHPQAVEYAIRQLVIRDYGKRADAPCAALGEGQCCVTVTISEDGRARRGRACEPCKRKLGTLVIEASGWLKKYNAAERDSRLERGRLLDDDGKVLNPDADTTLNIPGYDPTVFLAGGSTMSEGSKEMAFGPKRPSGNRLSDRQRHARNLMADAVLEYKQTLDPRHLFALEQLLRDAGTPQSEWHTIADHYDLRYDRQAKRTEKRWSYDELAEEDDFFYGVEMDDDWD